MGEMNIWISSLFSHAAQLPLHYYAMYIKSPLYFHLMIVYYIVYPVDAGISDFIVLVYQAEIIHRLVAKPEMG